jgi:hypothetical protein
MNYFDRHSRWLVVALLIALVCGASASVFGADALHATATSPIQNQYSSTKGAAAGIRIVRMALTANDHLVDMRYAVTDLEKARKVLTRKSRILLQDEANGTIHPIANIGTVGVLRNLPSSDAKRGYVMMFNNTSRSVKRGDKVTLIIDNLRIGDIVVQ